MNEMAGQGLSEGSRLTSWDAIHSDLVVS